MQPRPWLALVTLLPLVGCEPTEQPAPAKDTGVADTERPPELLGSIDSIPWHQPKDTADSAGFTPPALQIDATAEPTKGSLPLTVSFDASGSVGAHRYVSWNFGDGSTAVGEQVEHTYLASGSHVVTARIADHWGQHSQTTLTIDVQPAGCPSVGKAEVLGKVGTKEIDEASGLVESRQNPGVLWVHNDSGDGPSLYAITHAGEFLGAWELDNGSARDWEDLAIGRDPATGEHLLYVGDVGDNGGNRDNIAVYLVPEPSVDPKGGEQGGEISAGHIELSYPDGEAHNSETLMVDPVDETLYVVTKSYDGVSGVFRKPAPHVDGESFELEEVVWLDFSKDPLGGSATTGGEFSLLGDRFAIRTYHTTVHLWLRDTAVGMKEILQGEPCALVLPSERQSETIAFSPTDNALISISEGESQPVNWVPLVD